VSANEDVWTKRRRDNMEGLQVDERNRVVNNLRPVFGGR
jgi:hypothetical protein